MPSKVAGSGGCGDVAHARSEIEAKGPSVGEGVFSPFVCPPFSVQTNLGLVKQLLFKTLILVKGSLTVVSLLWALQIPCSKNYFERRKP